jgi:hypothetical protein
MKDLMDLTDKQFAMIHNAYDYPFILTGQGEKRTANSLVRHGYGDVEDGAGEAKIFRLNQAGSDAWRDGCEFWG